MNEGMTDATAGAVTAREPSHDSPGLSGRALGLTVAAIAGTGDLCILYVASHAEREPAVFVILLSAAWIMAQFGLLSTWLGLGGGPLCLRLLIAAPPVAAAANCLNPNGLESGTFADMAIFLVVGAVPFGLIYLLGYHMSREVAAAAPADGLEKYRSRQISLRQLFGWTVAVALVASVARYSSIQPRELFELGALSLVFFSISAGAVLATLFPKEAALVGIMLVLIEFATAILTVAVAQIVGMRGSGDVGPTVIVAMMHVAIMSGVLLGFRAIGYRLRRRGAG